MLRTGGYSQRKKTSPDALVAQVDLAGAYPGIFDRFGEEHMQRGVDIFIPADLRLQPAMSMTFGENALCAVQAGKPVA